MHGPWQQESNSRLQASRAHTICSRMGRADLMMLCSSIVAPLRSTAVTVFMTGWMPRLGMLSDVRTFVPFKLIRLCPLLCTVREDAAQFWCTPEISALALTQRHNHV
jgi:hypothetical protein